MIASWSRRVAASVGLVNALVLSLILVSGANAASPFTLFETGQVRRLATSPDGMPQATPPGISPPIMEHFRSPTDKRLRRRYP